MRVKRGVTTHKRHKKLRQATKGMQHARRASPRLAKQAITRSLQYQYRDRRNKKRDFRRLWIARINAAAREHDTSYSQLIKQMKVANVDLDRKVLSELASKQPHVFDAIIKAVAKK